MTADGFSFDPWESWTQSVPPQHEAFTSIPQHPDYVGEGCQGGHAADGKQCDEHPYFASEQGGPFGDPSDPATWQGFTIKVVDKNQNQLEGGKYGAFKTACSLGTNDEFLVIPLPAGPKTRWFCE